MSLPLSGRVGVHHAGRVHPGANSQRLLLHAGRGPAGQVVLDPEHLRGPDGPTAAAAAAAAVRPGEQNNTRKKLQENRKVQQEKKQLYRTAEESMFCTNIETPRSPKAAGRAGNKTRTTKRGKKKKKKVCAGGSDPEFYSTAELLVCFLGLIQLLTLEDGKISSLRVYFKDF